MHHRDPNIFFPILLCTQLEVSKYVSVPWDDFGTHFYTNWECHFSHGGFLTWNFNIILQPHWKSQKPKN